MKMEQKYIDLGVMEIICGILFHTIKRVRLVFWKINCHMGGGGVQKGAKNCHVLIEWP